jgi:hypothetical protein
MALPPPPVDVVSCRCRWPHMHSLWGGNCGMTQKFHLILLFVGPSSSIIIIMINHVDVTGQGKILLTMPQSRKLGQFSWPWRWLATVSPIFTATPQSLPCGDWSLCWWALLSSCLAHCAFSVVPMGAVRLWLLNRCWSHLSDAASSPTWASYTAPLVTIKLTTRQAQSFQTFSKPSRL